MKAKHKSFTSFFLAFLLFFGGNAWGQTTYTWTGTTNNTWLTTTNWSVGGSYPNASTHIALFNNNTQAATGINMNTLGGTLTIAAINWGTSATTARTISNSSGTVSGTLTLAGTTLNSISNTIIWNQSSTTHTITNGSSAMNIGLNNSTNNVIQITGTGGITIANIITGGNPLTKDGAGAGVLTLSGVNTYSGNTTISAGTLALSGAGSIANSPIITVGSGGTFNVSGLTTALSLGSGQTLNGSATGSNTTGTITVASGKGITLSAGGLAFTAYGGGATAPLTVTGASAGALALNSAPVALTTTTPLTVGTYTLIAKSGSATGVTGTPGTLTVNGSGLASGTTGVLSVVSGQLILTVSSTGYAITVTQATGGTITPSTTTVTSGGSQSFTATPDACYNFTNWVVDGSNAGSTNPYSFTNVTATHSITAVYTLKTFGITATAGSNGTISSPGTTNVNCGSNQTYTFTPNSCYTVATLTVDGVPQTPAGSYTFTNVTSTHTIDVTFGISSTYNIDASAGSNGNISPSGTTAVNCGASQAYTITPNSCYSISDVLVDGVSNSGAIAAGTYTFTSVGAAHTISASFVLNTYNINATAGSNGTISSSGITAVNCGANKTYTITPNSCYSVSDVLVDGISVGAVTSYTFTNVTTSHTISATFVINGPYNIVASAGANGSISSSGTTSVSCGSNKTYTITPNSGYAIADVLVDGVSNSGAIAAGSYTFSNVTTTHTISVTFVAIYSVTVNQAIGGTISPSTQTGIVSGTSSSAFTATPTSCYNFTSWTIDGTPNASTTNPYTFTNVTANHTLTAAYTIKAYDITASAGANGSISPNGTTSVNCGSNQAYTITPNSGYAIATVLVDGVSNSGAVAAGSYTFSNVTATHTISVTFVALPVSKIYKLITSTSDLEVGKKYLIANTSAVGSGNALGSQNTTYRNLSGITVATGPPVQITTTPASSSSGTEPFEITIQTGSDGTHYYLYDAVNNTYLIPATGSSSNNYLTGQSSPSDWTITFSTKAIITNTGHPNTNGRNLMSYNSGASRFACYSSEQAPIYLYKEDCSPPTTPTGSFTTGTAVCGSTDITYTGTIPGGETYYWQTTTTGISTTYPVTSGVAFSAPSSGVWYIRSKVSTCWSAELASPSITVTQAVSISTQPANTSVVAGSSASFSVAATNGSGYQWQLNTGSGWNDIIGETGASYNIPSATSGMNGYQYRCVVKGTSPCSDVNSNAATLTVTNPVVNTISNQSNVYGSTINLTVTATAAVSSWSATLPAGLSINTSGVITGTLTEDVINSPFSCSVTANFTAGGSNTKNFTWTITPKTLTISGLTGNNKVYDGNTTATLSGTASLVGIVGSDNVTLSGTPASTFNNKNVGTGKPITVTGYTLTGTKAGNYTLTQPTGITGNITAKALTVTGATAQDKTYDGTTAATITGATPVGVISPDVVTIGGGGTFASANAGTGISVTAGLTLGGADAGNYTLTQPTGLSANINKANPVFTTSAINVSVGGTYALPGTSISSTSGGAFSYSITGGGNATLSGTTITGVVVGTETLTVTQASTANYNAGSITVTVNVSTITYQHGDFRTKTVGKWSYNSTPPSDITQWQKYNSSINDWEDFVGQPNTNPSYTAYITKNTEIPTDATAHGRAKIIVMRDPVTNVAPTLTFKPSVNWTFKNVVIKEGATIEMQTKGFNVDALGDFEIEDGGNFIFNYSSNGSPASGLPLWAGNEIFHPESNFYIYNHTANSGEYFLPPATDITSNIYSGVEGYFGNLIIQSTDGNGFKLTTSNLSSTTKYLTHKDLTINTVSAYTLLYGSGTWIIGRDLKIGSTASNALTLTTGANTITFNVKRNLIKSNGNIFRFLNNTTGGNVSINVDGDVQVNSGTVDVNFNATGVGLINTKGSLTVESGSSLTASSATTTTPSAVVKFSGANIQNVSGAGTINIYHMVTDKTGGYVNLQRDLQTKRTLTMTAGNIQTNANLFELGESTSNTGTLSYTSGFVLGNMKRWFSGTSAGTDTKDLFPLGFYETGFGSDGLKNRFAKVRFTGGSPSGALTAFFVGSPMGNNSIPILVGSANSAPDVTFDITSTEDQGYWDISVSSGTFTSAETYTMTLLGEGFKTINNTTDLVLLKRPNIPTAWFVPGTSGFGAINSSYGSSIPSVVRNGVSLFSNYGFGGGDPNPLPVELTSFTGNCVEEGMAKIAWSTASEFNSKEFIVQRSTDGIHYTDVKTVPSGRNSNQLRHYSITDTSAAANNSYYRLVEVDNNGKQTIYSFIQVQCDEVDYLHVFYAQANMTVEVSSNRNKEIGFNIYEISGRLVHHETRQINRGFSRFDLNLQKKLPDGIYIIQMTDGNDVNTTKVMVH